MIAGRVPFPGRNEQSVVDSQLHGIDYSRIKISNECKDLI